VQVAGKNDSTHRDDRSRAVLSELVARAISRREKVGRNVRRYVTWLFSEHEENASWLHVILWWEVRRIPYNLIVGLLGMISLLLFFFTISARVLEPGEDAIEPLALVATVIGMNVFYTAGWVVELCVRVVCCQRSPTVGPALLKLGLILSVVLVLLPSTVSLFVWIATF